MRDIMRDIALAFAVMLILAASGCSLLDVDKKAAKAQRPVVIVTDSVNKAEPVISALEDATGRTINPNVANKGERVAGTVERVARTGAGVAVAIGQPGIGGFLGALAGLAGAIATFFQRRKAKAMAKAASRAADKVSGGGKAIVAEALKLGVADELHKAYMERKDNNG